MKAIRITGSHPMFIHLEDMLQDVVDFHVKHGINYVGPVRNLPPELAKFRDLRQQEEQQEYLDATTMEEKLDALVDAAYILFGTAHLHGITPKIFYEAWRRVHAANMRKERASVNNPGKYGDSNDIVKSPEWVEPDLKDLV